MVVNNLNAGNVVSQPRQFVVDSHNVTEENGSVEGLGDGISSPIQRPFYIRRRNRSPVVERGLWAQPEGRGCAIWANIPSLCQISNYGYFLVNGHQSAKDFHGVQSGTGISVQVWVKGGRIDSQPKKGSSVHGFGTALDIGRLRYRRWSRCFPRQCRT